VSLPTPPPRSWPAAVTAIVVLALQYGWTPAEVLKLVALLLVMLGLLHAAGGDR
jgi:hypothetical protein